MGRPPIGPKAMTEAERKHRQRAGLTAKRAKGRAPAEPVPKTGRPDHRDEEIAKLKARIAELEASERPNAPSTGATKGRPKQVPLFDAIVYGATVSKRAQARALKRFRKGPLRPSRRAPGARARCTELR